MQRDPSVFEYQLQEITERKFPDEHAMVPAGMSV
jgi:hypothetical protein